MNLSTGVAHWARPERHQARYICSLQCARIPSSVRSEIASPRSRRNISLLTELGIIWLAFLQRFRAYGAGGVCIAAGFIE